MQSAPEFNPRNPKSRLRMETKIQVSLTKSRRNPKRGIQNPRLSWITLHTATNMNWLCITCKEIWNKIYHSLSVFQFLKIYIPLRFNLQELGVAVGVRDLYIRVLSGFIQWWHRWSEFMIKAYHWRSLSTCSYVQNDKGTVTMTMSNVHRRVFPSRNWSRGLSLFICLLKKKKKIQDEWTTTLLH